MRWSSSTAPSPSPLCDALCDPRRRPRFESNPPSGIGLRGEDPVELQRGLGAERVEEALCEDHRDADGRPCGKRWPEYGAAVGRVERIRCTMPAGSNPRPSAFGRPFRSIESDWNENEEGAI